MKLPSLLKKRSGMQGLLPASLPGALGRFRRQIGGGGRRLLACETDGFVLRAAVVVLNEGKAVIEAWAESRAIDLKEALSELIAALKKNTANLPRRAILMSPSVLTAMLELPLKGKARSEREMQELIRWEMEPLFAQQVTRWNLGTILLGRGDLDQDQREEIILKSRGANAKQGARFGERAIELGMVSRTQVEEALQLQEHLQVMDDTLLCGWSAPTDGGEYTGWLCCALGKASLQRFREAFAHHHIRLDWLYPQIGPALAALSRAGDGIIPVLEIQQGMVACVLGESGAITGMQFTQGSGDRLSVGDCLEVCHALLRTSMTTLWLSGSYAEHLVLVKQLEERLDRPLKPIPVVFKNGGAPPWSAAGLLGASMHVFALEPKTRLVRVIAEPPPPPVYRRPAVWAATAALAIIFCLGALEYSFYAQRRILVQEERAYLDKLAIIESEERRVGKQKTEAEHAEERLISLQGALKAANLRYILLHEVLPARLAFVRGFMGRLGSTLSPEFALNRVTELPSGVIEIQGWALSEQAAQQFVRDLAEMMQPWSFTLEDLEVRSESGRLALSGYGVTLRLLPVKKTPN